ncbi:MAG: HAD family phosphatase [Leptolyngbyaceae cyanobacterium MO_188.B28]|nr:HAD family phosphatase [Leptolyngbyaceae cyanobacterium MO_188.B28]
MITHIVSDMGGVLVDIEWAERIGKLFGRSLPMDELHAFWVNARSPVEFESGRINFDQFATAFIQEFNLDVSPETVQHEFLEIVRRPNQHCNQVVSTLKQTYHLSLLSNTSLPHYEKLRDRFQFFEPFDHLFLSYEIGLMKPSNEIYEHVLSVLDVSPESVAFFDDSLLNVEAARKLGIHACQVRSPEEIMAIVEGFGTM